MPIDIEQFKRMKQPLEARILELLGPNKAYNLYEIVGALEKLMETMLFRIEQLRLGPEDTSTLLFALADQIRGAADADIIVTDPPFHDGAAAGRPEEPKLSPSWQAWFDFVASSPPAPEVRSYRDILEDSYDRH